MRFAVKIIAVLLFLHFSVTVKAQSPEKDVGGMRATSAKQNKKGNAGVSITSVSANKDHFIGIWGFMQFGTDPDNLGPAALGVLKINTDSAFTVVRYQNNQAVITQTGTSTVYLLPMSISKKRCSGYPYLAPGE